MNDVNKTLYIPLYGKSYVSRKGIILADKKAEEIWEREGFSLKGKSKSKWLAYYMGIRSAVFDRWLKEQMTQREDAVVVHIGCGMDSRVLRIGTQNHPWYDVDFPEVILERKRYYQEAAHYRMIAADVRHDAWLNSIPKSRRAIVVMEGVSMYMDTAELKALMARLTSHFDSISLLMDCYTALAAKMSKYRNPVKDVGVTKVYGLDDPKLLECNGLVLTREADMTPSDLISELSGLERYLFRKLYAGTLSKKLYRLFEYQRL